MAVLRLGYSRVLSGNYNTTMTCLRDADQHSIARFQPATFLAAIRNSLIMSCVFQVALDPQKLTGLRSAKNGLRVPDMGVMAP